MKSSLAALAACLLLFSTPSIAADEQERVVAQIGDDGVQRASIVGGDYFFKPARVVVRVNMPVELALSREAGVVPHSFVIDAPQAGIVADEELNTAGKTFRFISRTVGVYPFYCRHKLLFFKSHRERGMEGVLEVVP